MNKPAPKEPSMDEILSSIRQIIADDDAAGVSRRPVLHSAPPPMEAAPAAMAADSVDASDQADEEPLTLSSTQILEDDDETDGNDVSFDALLADTANEAVDLVDPEDVAFEPGGTETRAFTADAQEPPQPQPEPVAFDPPPREAPRPTAMPDPTLSEDMADQLLEPATNAAVRSNFARLNSLGLGTQGLTVEAMVREMLRPMLKEWLDENLPSVVERMVEKEIARVSRGE
ncbi:DUF2497 domain-containing protein [Devosia nitrariae]|nr:DUF2497 domain-containing protein [Devosia nitrariae]